VSQCLKDDIIRGMRYVVGIDEVGRGSLAGPVMVCAAAVPPSFSFSDINGIYLRDSKQLSSHQREHLVTYFEHHSQIYFFLSTLSSHTIDRISISRAANRGALSALHRLHNELSDSISTINLDGRLYLGDQRDSHWKSLPVHTIVKGDEVIPAIAVASIYAKVMRDRFMQRLGMRYPGYGLAVHKGYGTMFHRTMIKAFGSTKIHRTTFLRNI